MARREISRLARWITARLELTHVRTRNRSPHTNGVVTRTAPSSAGPRLPNATTHCRHDIPTDIDLTSRVLRRDLVHPAMPTIVDGWIAPPTAPGLGIELNMDLVRRFQAR